MKSRSLEITLCDISLKYLDDIYEYSKNEEFCKYLSFNSNTTKEETKAFIEFLIEENKSGNRKYFTILLEGKAIGTIGFLNIEGTSAEVGFGVSKEYWGLGIASNALETILDYGFNRYGFNTIIVGTSKQNIRTQKFIKKHKFQEYKSIKDSIYFIRNKET